MSNARNKEQYNNGTPVAYASATPQTFRFPLTALPNDLWSCENGIWPGEYKRKTILEIYWEAPAYCIYAQGAIVGTTFSFGYSVDSWNFQIVQTMDPNLDNLISSRGIMLSYVEWYWYQQSITIAAQQSIQFRVLFPQSEELFGELDAQLI